MAEAHADMGEPGATTDMAGGPDLDAGTTAPDPTPTPSRVCAGDYDITSAAQLQALGGCREITGSLGIHDASDIDNLLPLGQLQRVGSQLTIVNVPLETLHGLESLESVDGTLQIVSNPKLVDVTMPSLTSVINLYFFTNGVLEHIGGLVALTVVSGDLRFDHDPRLNAIDALPSLKVLGGLSIVDDPQLVGLGPCDGVRAMTRQLMIEKSSLVALDAFPNLVRIDAQLDINGAPNLHDLQLPALQTVAALNIADVPSLSSLSGLSSLRNVESWFTMSGALGFTDLHGLESLSSVASLFSITGTSGLTSLDGLGAVTVGGAGVGMSQNADLVRVDALERLVDTGSQLAITENPQLPPCQATAVLAALQAHGFTGTSTLVGNGGTGSCK